MTQYDRPIVICRHYAYFSLMGFIFIYYPPSVVTSSSSTGDAGRLAKANHTILVDREQLGKWIIQFQQGRQNST
jgi:hypothetical protein